MCTSGGTNIEFGARREALATLLLLRGLEVDIRGIAPYIPSPRFKFIMVVPVIPLD